MRRGSRIVLRSDCIVPRRSFSVRRAGHWLPHCDRSVIRAVCKVHPYGPIVHSPIDVCRRVVTVYVVAVIECAFAVLVWTRVVEV